MNIVMLIAIVMALWMLVVGPRVAGFVLLLLMTCLWMFIAMVSLIF